MSDCQAESPDEGVGEESQVALEGAAPISLDPSGGGWGEVAAVLATGVIPNFTWAAAHSFNQETYPPLSYWMDSITLTTQSVCTAFVVLYLIHRSGEPAQRFGLVPPRLSDFLLYGPALFLLAWVVWDLRWKIIPQLDPPGITSWFPKPKRHFDYVMMIIKHAANAFSEELVTRAYLVTRLEELLKSQTAAVVIAAITFASYHVYQRTDGMVDTMFLGVAWGTAYLFVRRLWPFVVAHTLCNVVIEILY